MKEYRHVTLLEREEIARMKTQGASLRMIGVTLSRHPTTISREIDRNRNRFGEYRARDAHREAVRRRHIVRKPLRMSDEVLRKEVEVRIVLDWSAEQIEGWRRRHGQKPVSRTTIYRHVAQKDELKRHFRGWGRTARGRSRQDRIHHRVMIDQRPIAAHQRAEVGHWEGDSMRGPMSSSAGLATLVDRKIRYLLIGKVTDRRAATWNAVAQARLEGHPAKSITVDNGMEFASHQELAAQTKVSVYFAHAKSPWERGTNENHNRLIRQYLPKLTDLAKVSDAKIQWIQDRINTRPRKGLGYYSPAELIDKHFCPPGGGKGAHMSQCP